MPNTPGSRRAFAPTLVPTLLVAVLTAAPASAQFRPRVVPVNRGIAEDYHIEGSASFWFPTADLTVASGGSGALSGLTGSDISAKQDLGLQDKGLIQLDLVVRPARHHKFRVQYIPIKYEQTSTLTRDIDFNGQRYHVGIPVNSSLDWKALRLGYEYDFIVKDRGFGGFIIEDKQTDVTVDLLTPLIPEQFAHAQSPIPALGGIARVYPHPRVSITGEVTGFRLPNSIKQGYSAHYVDVDVYGVINATKNVGVRAGFRAIDLGYVFDADRGTMTMKGLYFGIVARY